MTIFEREQLRRRIAVHLLTYPDFINAVSEHEDLLECFTEIMTEFGESEFDRHSPPVLITTTG